MNQDIYLRVLKAWFQFGTAKPTTGSAFHLHLHDEGWYKLADGGPGCYGQVGTVWHEVIQDWIDKGYVKEIKYEDMYEDCSIPVDWNSIDPEYIERLRS